MKMQNKIKLGGSKVLNEYHQQRSNEACLAVEEMLKHPISLDEMRKQTYELLETCKKPSNKP